MSEATQEEWVTGLVILDNIGSGANPGEMTGRVTYYCEDHKHCNVTLDTYMIDRLEEGASTWVWDNSVPARPNPEGEQSVRMTAVDPSKRYKFVVTLFTAEGPKVVSNTTDWVKWGPNQI